MNWAVLLSLGLALLGSLASPVTARPVKNGERTQFRMLEPAEPPAFNSARVDTFWLFAASGPGAFGTPGTDGRGYTFDDFSGECTQAGWTEIDATAQLGQYWHLADAQMNAGHGTQAVLDIPQADGLPNDFALWCGRENVCGWANPTGYGNYWDQYWVAELGGNGAAMSAAYDFCFVGDFEGNDYDHFELLTEEANGDLYEILSNHVEHEQTLRYYTGIAGGARNRLIWRFFSDGAWSDEDGDYLSDIGAAWIDRIVIDSSFNDYNTDFEEGIVPIGMHADIPPGAGYFGAPYEDLESFDTCNVNDTCAWAFFDTDLDPVPPYQLPPVPFGGYYGPWIDDMIASPLLERKHTAGDPDGQTFELGPEDAVYFDHWVYLDNALEALIFYRWDIAARTEESSCLGRWENDNTVYWGGSGNWIPASHDATLQVTNSAAGGTITGVMVRIGVIDMGESWYGGWSEPQTPAPYFDNCRVKILSQAAVAWNIDVYRRFQDNFPEAGNDKVRIDSAINIEPANSPTVVVGDSTLIECNADLAGGIKVNSGNPSGENRPELYCYFRVIGGPHAGSTSSAMGDADAADGIWSPYIGIEDIHGGTWNFMIADSAANQGQVADAKWAFDFNDAYFDAGDVIEYFYQVETTGGVRETQPPYAKADPEEYPLLASYYIGRCLPTAGAELLFCDDGLAAEAYWDEAFRYNGYTDYDTYQTQAPSSGLENGLSGRAALDDIDPYRVIVWDSDRLLSETLTNGSVDANDKTDDTDLLEDWLVNAGHDAYLWVLGNYVANDLKNSEPFLGGELGAYLLTGGTHYCGATGISTPKIIDALPCVEDGDFWLDGRCPNHEDFSLIRTNGTYAVASQLWETVPAQHPTAVAGTFNSDPDGNGSTELPYRTRAIFSPWGYRNARNAAGPDLPLGADYVRKMVGSVLAGCFDQRPDAEPDAVPEVPAFTSLDGSFPNPFNPKTTIRFSLSADEIVNLSIYDLSGRLVRQLIDGPIPAGIHEIVWDGKDSEGIRTASGVYFTKMNAGAFSATQRMVMLK